jgi:hypothetical protein
MKESINKTFEYLRGDNDHLARGHGFICVLHARGI